jgi:hypothetical protein
VTPAHVVSPAASQQLLLPMERLMALLEREENLVVEKLFE